MQSTRDKLNDEEVISYYLTPHTIADTAENFKITVDDVNGILVRNNIQTTIDAMNFLYKVKNTKKTSKIEKKEPNTAPYSRIVSNIICFLSKIIL